jgi:signal transduction histidine kinase
MNRPPPDTSLTNRRFTHDVDAYNRAAAMLARPPVTPFRLLLVFVALAAAPLVALGVFGRRFLEQDRASAALQLHERLDGSAALVSADLDRSLGALEQLAITRAAERSAPLPSATVVIQLGKDGVRTHRGVALPYYPQVPDSPTASPATFAPGEQLERRDRNLAAASSWYRALGRTNNRTVRAGALMRLARCLRADHKPTEALAVYADLAAMNQTEVAGSPAALVGLVERAAIFGELHDAAARERELAQLAARLTDGTLTIDRTTFDFFAEGTTPRVSDDGRDFARVAEQLWPRWQGETNGRLQLMMGARPIVSVWRNGGGETTALITTIDTVMASVRPLVQRLGIVVSLDDPSGAPVTGRVPMGRDIATKTFRESGLPWTIHVAFSQPPPDLSTRTRLFAGGFVLIALVIGVAGYVVVRSLNHELNVARLQSEFVATVSHEFRTPLTAMRHLTEVLEDGTASADRLPHYYRARERDPAASCDGREPAGFRPVGIGASRLCRRIDRRGGIGRSRGR